MFDKNEILKRILKKEDKVLIGNILDKYVKHKKSNVNTYTNF